jgi:outer membrane immunogenic protein
MDFLKRGQGLIGIVAMVLVVACIWPAAPAAAQNYNWTGIYIGAHAGYARGTHDVEAVGPNIYNDPNEHFGYDTNGFIGGIQSGYNHQIGMFVPGLEVDFGYKDLNGREASPARFNPRRDTFSISNGGVYGTVTGRLGVAVDRVLIYFKGGYAFAQLNLGVIDNDPRGITINAVNRSTRSGWTTGGGAEYAFTGNWSVKAEYLFMNFGSTTISAVSPDTDPPASFKWNHDTNAHTFKVGINYKFNL